MIQQEFTATSNFFGKDPIVWWIGQVTDPKKGKWDKAQHKVKLDSKEEIYTYRCRVRIVGYHDCAGDLPDDELPMAHVLMPPNSPNIGGQGATFNYHGGEVVLGFFLDGADAQQPVVFGSLFKQEFNRDTGSYANKREINFQPWTPEEIKSKSGGGPGIQNVLTEKIKQNNYTYNAPQDGGSTNGQKAVSELEDIESDDVTPCEDTQLGKIKLAMENFIKKLNSLQKILDGYVDPIVGKIVNINEEIKYVAGLIFDTMTNLIRRARTWVVQQILKLFKDFLSKLIPFPFRKLTAKALKTIVDLIVCIFEKIIKQLFDYLTNSLGNLVGKVIDFPQCAVENFLGNMLGQLYNVLDANLGPLLSQVNNVLQGALGSASSIISQGLKFANLFLSILECDKLKCRPPRKWRNATGPTNEEIDNFKNVLGKASLSSIISPTLDSVNKMIDAEGTAPDCDTNIFRCGPPRIDFVGGEGQLASGSAVVNAIGNLIGVAIDNSGFGFVSPPLVTFYDSCNNGYGAYGTAVLGPVSESSPGVYSPDPDGNETGVIDIVMISDGGGYLPNTTETTPEGTREVVPDPNSNTGGSTSYVVDIKDVVVKDTGFGYDQNATVTILSCDGETPDASGARIDLTVVDGFIVKAKVVNGGSGFTCIPELVINSSTGTGATLLPIMNFTKVETAKQVATTTQTAVVTVIDCVQR